MANTKPTGVAYSDPLFEKVEVSGGLAMFGATPLTAQLSALTTAAVSALTTTGAATLATTQLSNLTTTQLSTLCTNNDLLVTALNKVQTDLNSIRAALRSMGVTG